MVATTETMGNGEAPHGKPLMSVGGAKGCSDRAQGCYDWSEMNPI